MLIHTHHWNVANLLVVIECPTCSRDNVMNRDALDVDYCVYVDCCGGSTVRLVGYASAPPPRRATGAA